jgi:hypothetical protein
MSLLTQSGHRPFPRCQLGAKLILHLAAIEAHSRIVVEWARESIYVCVVLVIDTTAGRIIGAKR